MIYITDDRYLTATLEVVNAIDDDAARGRARTFLASSEHHLSVEVWEEDRLVARIARDYDSPPA